MQNILFDIDSYKASHYLQYPPGTTKIHAYLEARGSSLCTELVFFGLQPILKSFLKLPNYNQIYMAAAFYKQHGVPFNFEGWISLRDAYHEKGLPLKIYAHREGDIVPLHTPLLTVENTDERFPWLTSWVETRLMRIWYPVTVATLSREVKKIIYSYLARTSDKPDEEIPFKLHDFGSRGVSSLESAAIGGAAHLVNFMGSDTVPALFYLRENYDADMAGYSIPAAEHSTISAWGRDREVDAYKNMLDQFADPGSLVAIVSDTYDLQNAVIKLWGGELKQKVIDSGATVIIRPDSGDPLETVMHTLSNLADAFGTSVNSKGYRVLNHVRVIQGDGVNLKSIQSILSRMEKEGYSATNIAFGMGGALLQKVNRDTLNFGYKTSWAEINGKGVNIQKQPVGDKMKWSKAGRQDSGLEKVYDNGTIISESLGEIRERARLVIV